MNSVSDSFANSAISSWRVIGLIVVTVVVTLILSSMLALWLSHVTDLTIPSMATVVTLELEAYSDPDLRNRTETIDWGTIWPGKSKNVTLYLRSISNVETTLRFSTMNWNPLNISNFINFSWSYDGTPLQPEEIREITITVSASSSYSFMHYLFSNEVKDFSFDILIESSEHHSQPRLRDITDRDSARTYRLLDSQIRHKIPNFRNFFLI